MLEWLEEEWKEIVEAGLERTRIVVEKRRPGEIVVGGKTYIDLSSNDYLGCACDPRVVQAGRQAALETGWGAGASALVGGYTRWHQELENTLARFKKTEAAVVFPSGFSANLGVLSALAGPKDIIFSDRRNHASLIDGCRLSKATLRIYESDALENLEGMLQEATGFRRRLIVTDSVFSMDGDIAPLPDLCDLADRFDCLLHVDEAHATGVLGEKGRGAAEHAGVAGRLPYHMGTLSKSLGSVGGFVAGPARLVDYLVNRVRPYIYSTNVPASSAAASLESLRILESEPHRRETLRKLVQRLAREMNLTTRLGVAWETPILPVILGSIPQALHAAEMMKEEGFWTTAIRPPTVPAGTSRLRLSLSSAHRLEDIARLAGLLVRLSETSGAGA